LPHEIGSNVTITVTVSTVQRASEVFEKLKEGGQVLLPLEEKFWSPTYGQVIDKFSVFWHISTAQENNN
jgi:PhnB protein